jgi:short subunit dehydrogenase-like uncharacterized protein
VARGLQPIIAGRSPDKTAERAAELGLEHQVFALDDAAAMETALADGGLILNCAGPFFTTAQRLVEGCLRTRTHYLDIAGEVPEFEALAARDAEAKAADVMLLPGVGFGIVPTDCLAVHLKQRLPSATHLTLAFEAVGGISQGTASILIKDLLEDGVVRREGKLTPVRPAWKRRQIDFGAGPVPAVTNPWRGDISAAYYSTGIPNIDVYTAFPAPIRWLMASSRYVGGIWSSAPVQRFLKGLVRRLPPGPSDDELERGLTRVWGEVMDDSGQTVTARLHGPEAYRFTALTALTIVERVLNGHVSPGFQTPALAYGPDLVVEIDGVRRED